MFFTLNEFILWMIYLCEYVMNCNNGDVYEGWNECHPERSHIFWG